MQIVWDLQFFLDLDEFCNAVVHFLDSVEFGETHAPLVGDVIDATFGFCMFTAGTADLQIVFAGNFFELGLVGGELGYFDVDRSTDSGTQVGWAESEETEPVVVGEGQPFFDVVYSTDQTPENGAEVTTHLHGNDTKMIFFVDPNQEGFVVVVIDTTSRWPETARVGGLQEAVTFLEQEVVVDQFLLDFFAHASKWVEGTFEFT